MKPCFEAFAQRLGEARPFCEEPLIDGGADPFKTFQKPLGLEVRDLGLRIDSGTMSERKRVDPAPIRSQADGVTVKDKQVRA